MQLLIGINQRLKADVDLSAILDGIDKLHLTERVNIIAHLINNITDEEYDDLTPGQKKVIQQYCQKQAEKFSNEKVLK